MRFIMKLITLLKVKIEAKKIHRLLEFKQSQWQ